MDNWQTNRKTHSESGFRQRVDEEWKRGDDLSTIPIKVFILPPGGAQMLSTQWRAIQFCLCTNQLLARKNFTVKYFNHRLAYYIEKTQHIISYKNMRVEMCHHLVVSYKISAAKRRKNSSVHVTNLRLYLLCSLCLLSQLQTCVPCLSSPFCQHLRLKFNHMITTNPCLEPPTGLHFSNDRKHRGLEPPGASTCAATAGHPDANNALLTVEVCLSLSLLIN